MNPAGFTAALTVGTAVVVTCRTPLRSLRPYISWTVRGNGGPDDGHGGTDPEPTPPAPSGPGWDLTADDLFARWALTGAAPDPARRVS